MSTKFRLDLDTRWNQKWLQSKKYSSVVKLYGDAQFSLSVCCTIHQQILNDARLLLWLCHFGFHPYLSALQAMGQRLMISGNQTPNVACAVLERLFHDPNFKLWDYDADTLLPNLPQMVTFPNLQNFYAAWVDDLRSKGVDIRLKTDVCAVLSRSDKGVVIQTQPFDPTDDHGLPVGVHTGPPAATEKFDEMVLAMLADDAKRLLGKAATWKEKFVLGGARFYDDVTITHSDSKYFQKHYETHFNPDLCAKPKNEAQEHQIAFAKGEVPNKDSLASGFRPMYYIKEYAEDPMKIEMSFDVCVYTPPVLGACR